MSTKCPRIRRRLLKLGILSAPIVAWAAVLLIVPTGWARDRLTARLAEATGRSVRIGSLSIGVFGNLRVNDIAIAETQTPQDPWVTVPEAQIDVHLGQVLMGRCSPSEIRLFNPTVRMLRSASGVWECGSLTHRDTHANQPTDPASENHASVTNLVIEGGKLRIEDRSSGVRFDLVNLQGRGKTAPGLLTLDELKAEMNGGEVNLAAHLEGDHGSSLFEAEFRFRDIDIDSGFDGLAHLMPIVAGGQGGIRGKLNLHVTAKGRGKTFADAMRSLHGNGSFAVAPVDLEGSRFLAELDVLGDWPSMDRVGSLSSNFTLADRRATSEDLTLRIDRFPLVLAGWTDFDGRFDYAVRADKMTEMLPKEARGWLREAGVNFDQLDGIRVRGGTNQVVATIHGRPLHGGETNGIDAEPNGGKDDDRSRLRETARRIRERFFR